MILVAWIIFGLLNALVLSSLDDSRKEGTLRGALLLGGVGAISGAMFAYLLFSGSNLHIVPGSAALLTLDCIALALLIQFRNLRHI